MKALFLSYDGLTDQLGGSQVLPYVAGLARLGHRLTIISFEKPGTGKEATDRVRQECNSAGIEWHPLPYHKRPPILSTLWDLWSMERKALELHGIEPFDLIHCRSYLSALVGLRFKRRRSVPFLFDMRGFWPDERVEGGTWNLSNPLFRAVFTYFKRKEREFFAEASCVVTLTNRAADDLLARPHGEGVEKRPTVIPCCVDFDHFRSTSKEARQQARSELDIAKDASVLCYLGSLGTYYLFDDMLRFFLAYRDRNPSARFLFITRDDPKFISDAASRYGIGGDELFIRAADRSDVPRLLTAADAGISFIMPTYSKSASSPTKLGEMMAVGLPMVVNSGVGDVDAVMADTGAGVMVDSFDSAALSAAADSLGRLKIQPAEIRAGAERWFRLEEGVAAFDRIYRSIGTAGMGQVAIRKSIGREAKG